MEDERAWELRGALMAACLPSVFGTLVLAALAAVQRMPVAGDVRLPDPGPLHAACILVVAVSFLASAYGPLILPLAAAAIWAERRRTDVTDPIATGALLLAMMAAIATHGWVLDAVELL